MATRFTHGVAIGFIKGEAPQLLREGHVCTPTIRIEQIHGLHFKPIDARLIEATHLMLRTRVPQSHTSSGPWKSFTPTNFKDVVVFIISLCRNKVRFLFISHRVTSSKLVSNFDTVRNGIATFITTIHTTRIAIEVGEREVERSVATVAFANAITFGQRATLVKAPLG